MSILYQIANDVPHTLHNVQIVHKNVIQGIAKLRMHNRLMRQHLLYDVITHNVEYINGDFVGT
jgi:hypothetical protein